MNELEGNLELEIEWDQLGLMYICEWEKRREILNAHLTFQYIDNTNNLVNAFLLILMIWRKGIVKLDNVLVEIILESFFQQLEWDIIWVSILKIDKKVIFFHMALLISLGTLGKKKQETDKKYIFTK